MSGHELDHEINLDEDGNLVVEIGIGDVWTATGGDGLIVNPTCQNWTSGEDTDTGRAGNIESFDGSWTVNDTVLCDDLLHLYCFEQ